MPFIAPMLPESQREPFNEIGWFHEPKFDGMRCIASITNGAATIYSRSGRILNLSFPTLVESLSSLPDCTLDGELVAYDRYGYVSLERLQSRWLLTDATIVAHQDSTNPVTLFAFDLLREAAISLTDNPIIERKQRLFATVHSHVEKTNRVQIVQHFDDPFSLFESCRLMKFDGIVSKLSSSKYEPGMRTQNWIKVKFKLEGIFQIVGKSTDGYVLYQGTKFVGNVDVGFGRSHIAALNTLRVMRQGKNTTYFIDRPMVKIEFIEWTSKGTLRRPVFKGFAV